MIMVVGPAGVNRVRMRTLLLGLRMEINTGMQLTRGRSAYAIIKSEYGLKGSRVRVLEQFAQIVADECSKPLHEDGRTA